MIDNAIEIMLSTQHLAPSIEEARERVQKYKLANGYRHRSPFAPLEISYKYIPNLLKFSRDNNVGVIIGGEESMTSRIKGIAVWFYQRESTDGARR